MRRFCLVVGEVIVVSGFLLEWRRWIWKEKRGFFICGFFFFSFLILLSWVVVFFFEVLESLFVKWG